MANTKITSRVIADDAVTTAAIADDAITSALVADNAIGIPALAVSDGSSGQVLTTNGSGTLSFATVSGTTINNNADNRIITGSGTANTLNGESGLIFDGSTLDMTGSGNTTLEINTGNDNGDNSRIFFADSVSDTAGFINYDHTNNAMQFASNGAEKMRILSSGGITFNGDTATANALDDYEEGTWRPTVAGATSAGSYVYGENAGVYTKIGNQVTCSFYILQLGANTEGSGALIINNLPFTVASITAGTVLDYFTGNVTFENFNVHTSTVNLASHAIAGTTHITFFETKDAALDGTVVTTDRVDGNADIIGQITYRTT